MRERQHILRFRCQRTAAKIYFIVQLGNDWLEIHYIITVLYHDVSKSWLRADSLLAFSRRHYTHAGFIAAI